LKMNLGSSALVLNIDAEREFPFLWCFKFIKTFFDGAENFIQRLGRHFSFVGFGNQEKGQSPTAEVGAQTQWSIDWSSNASLYHDIIVLVFHSMI
jgi:hypothetical protein